MYEADYKVHHPRVVNLICDATFYGKRKDKLGTLVFKDSITKEVLIWKYIQSETIKDYKHLLSELINLGYSINSITIDAKRGLYKAFEDYPVQMCHFLKRTLRQFGYPPDMQKLATETVLKQAEMIAQELAA